MDGWMDELEWWGPWIVGALNEKKERPSIVKACVKYESMLESLMKFSIKFLFVLIVKV
jgi:hypothetical protein